MLRRGRCAKCAQPFENEEAVFIHRQLYHVNHLCCDYCNMPINYIEESFIADSTKVACTRCFHKISPKCHKCKKSIVNEYVVNDDRLYHLDCFKCARCHRVLDVEYFQDNEDRPLDRDCLWGEMLMNCIIRDTDNIVPPKY